MQFIQISFYQRFSFSPSSIFYPLYHYTYLRLKYPFTLKIASSIYLYLLYFLMKVFTRIITLYPAPYLFILFLLISHLYYFCVCKYKQPIGFCSLVFIALYSSAKHPEECSTWSICSDYLFL